MPIKLPISEELAASLSENFLSLDQDLNALLRAAQGHLGDDELRELRRAIGNVLGTLYLDVMRAVYNEHPRLRPPGLPVD